MKASLWNKTCPAHPSALVYPGTGGRRCMECNALIVPDDTLTPSTAPPTPVAPALGIYQPDTIPTVTDGSALSIAKYSSGQFVTNVSQDQAIVFHDEQKIDLFGYGEGETLPAEAGFQRGHDPMPRGATNCRKSGALCADGEGYMIVGLAARVGQPRLVNATPAWLSAVDMQLRERIAESAVVDLLYNDRSFRYELGTLIQRPLNGAVFGPNVSLDGESPIDETKLFVPLRAVAISENTSRASIRLTIGSKIEIAAPCAGWRVAVPVKIWLFGYATKIQPALYCMLTPGSLAPTSFTWTVR